MSEHKTISDKPSFLSKALERIKYRYANLTKQRTLIYINPYFNKDECYSVLFYYLTDFQVQDNELNTFDRYGYVGDPINSTETLIEDDIIIEKNIDEYTIYKVSSKATGELYLNKIFMTSDINQFIDYCKYINQNEYKDKEN